MYRSKQIPAWTIAVALLLSAGGAFATDLSDPSAAAIWQKLVQIVRAEELAHRAAREKQLQEINLQLGPWYCVAPIGDENEYGYFSRCFGNAFPPEQDVVHAGRKQIDLNKTYEDGRLRWLRTAEWVDGFFHQLPIGPPPSRNETAYLYRTIRAKNDVTLKAHIVAEDAIRVWLDGKVIAQALREGDGRYKRFLEVELPLQQGENRLLIKVTSFHGDHGFGFALPLITPTSEFRPSSAGASGAHCLPANLQSTENHLHGGNRPYASARERSRHIPQPIEEADRGSVQIADVRVLPLSDENLITGGSFEPHGRPGDEDYILDAGSHHSVRKPGNTTGRWVQSAGPADGGVLGTGYQAHHGRQSYHPGSGHGEGKVSQSFPTMPGQQYLLSFYASGHPDADPVQSGTVAVADLDVTYQTPAGTNINTDMGWRQHVFFFTAAEQNSTLTFGTLAGLQGTITIDNVEVRAIQHESPIDAGSFAGSLAPDATKSGQLATKPGETYGLLLELAKGQSGRLRIHAGDLTTNCKIDAQQTRLGFIFQSTDSTATLTVTNPGIAAELLDAYARETIRLLDLPPQAKAVFPTTNDEQSLQIAQDIYHRAAEFSEATATVESFKFNVPRIPLYGPAQLPINRVLENSVAPTAGGRKFLARLDRLREQVPTAAEPDTEKDVSSSKKRHPLEKAIAATQRVAGRNSGKPSSRDALRPGYRSFPTQTALNLELLDVVPAARAIDRYWSETIGGLGPIAFIRRPLLKVNAVSPYNTPPQAPASICVFDPSRPDQPPKVIYDAPSGCIFDLNISYDAKTLFFSAWRSADQRSRDPEVEGGWHIYEIDIDGSGLKQITYGPDNDISPLLLPDGRVMFVSTRAGNMLVCQGFRAGVLYICNRDGRDVRRVSGNTLSDHTPQIMDDGRVLFTRWDYGLEKGVFSRQALWTMNPDGARFQLFFGNTIEDPNAFWQARPIPGRPEAVCTFGPHHSYQAGMIGLVYNGLGEEAPRGTGFRWITDELPIVADIGFPWGFQNAFPINEHLFLVSYGGDGEHRNRIYLLDDRGNRKCIYEDAELGCWHPIPLQPRKRPPVITPAGESPQFVRRDQVQQNGDPDSRTGTFVMQNVYDGLFPHVERGEITTLQIMEQVPKTHPHTGGYAWDISPIIGRGTFYVRRLIGTVPVEEDGSAYFVAPATRDISFNALGADGKTIQRMASTTQIMPGETISCIGCHEHQSEAPPQKRMALALKRQPSVPQRPDWGTNGVIDFVHVVQPILDKHCVECHSGPSPDGRLDLSGDKTRYFNMAYNQLVEMGWVHYVAMANADYERNVPKTYGSMVSRICQYLDKPHQGVTVPPEDRRTIYAWIDANVPYYGVYHYTDGTVRGARDRWYAHKPDQWFDRDFLPVFRRRCYECHAQQIDISQPWQGITYQTVTSKVWNGIVLNGHGFAGFDPYTTLYGPAQRINLTHPEFSQVLTAPLSKEAGGLGLCQPKEGLPAPFKDITDPDYQAMLRALRRGHETLTAHPRVDMLEIGKYSSEP